MNKYTELCREQLHYGMEALRQGHPSHALDYFQTAREMLTTALRDPTLPLPDCARFASALGKADKLISRTNEFMRGVA